MNRRLVLSGIILLTGIAWLATASACWAVLTHKPFSPIGWAYALKWWGTNWWATSSIIIAAAVPMAIAMVPRKIGFQRADVSPQIMRTFRNSFWRPEMRRHEWERPPE